MYIYKIFTTVYIKYHANYDIMMIFLSINDNETNNDNINCKIDFFIRKCILKKYISK